MANGLEMIKYLKTVRSMEKYLLGFSVKSIPREKINDADKLAKAAAQNTSLSAEVFYEVRKFKSINSNVNAISSEDWRAPIIAFLRGFYKPESEEDMKKMVLRARNYVMKGEELRKAGVVALLKCISRSEGCELLKEIHAGMCSSHIGTRKLVQKAFRQGSYWPSAVFDAEQVVRGLLRSNIPA